jgi:hypothetical protein
MVIISYYLVFPEGDIQEIEHPLKFGDLVDLNGNIFSIRNLNPSQITYRVSGIKSNTKFKETTYHYKLELFTANDVRAEIAFSNLTDKKSSLYDIILSKLENKLNKRSKNI